MPSGDAPKGPHWFLALAVAIVAAVYWTGFGNGFVWLDQAEILDGGLIVHDWEEAFSLFSNARNNPGYHRPAYSLMHSLDWALWGPHPRGYLFTSLLLHLANLSLVYFALRRLSLSVLAAAMVAGIWGLHPVNTAVAGLIHSKADLLYVLGVLGSGVLFLRLFRGASGAESTGGSSTARLVTWIGSGLAFLLALFSKENAMLFPVVVSSVLWLPKLWGVEGGAHDANERASLRRYVVMLWGLLAIVLIMRSSSMTAANYPSELSLADRVLTFGGVYVGYLQKLVLPLRLSIADTVTRFSAQTTAFQAQLGLSMIIAIGLQVWSAVKYPWLRRWILLFNLALVPVSQVIPALHFRADRFLYLPSLAFAGAAVEIARRALDHRIQTGDAVRGIRIALGVVVLSWSVLAFGRTALRLRDFRTDETLFQAELNHTPDYLEGLSVLGRTYDRLGQHARAGELFKLSLADYPGRVSYIDRGGVAIGYSYNLLARGELEDARSFLESLGGLKVSVRHRDELNYNLAVTQFRLGDFASALEGFKAYAAVHPDDPSCQYFLGKSAMEVQQPEVAVQALNRYLRLAPAARDRAQVQTWLDQLGD